MARILQVCNADFTLRIFIAPLVRALVANGHDVTCVCHGEDIPPGCLGEGVRVIQFAFPRSASPLRFAAAVQRFRKLLRGQNYLCVNSHNRDASIVARIAAWLEDVPVNLYTAHGCYFHDGQPPWLREATIHLERILARITDHTLSQSQEDTDLLIRRGIVPRKCITTIGNGIDPHKFAPDSSRDRARIEADLGLRPAPFRVAAVGRLVRGKGFMDLLSAFAAMATRKADDQLLLIGGNIQHDLDPFEDRFLRHAETLGIREQLVVSGLTDRVPEYLQAADVFVLPSYREGMPRALLEAMAMERPVIATDIRGCREIVQPGVTGYLYPPRGIGDLAAHLDKVRGQPAVNQTMGRAGRERVLKDFTEAGYVACQVDAIERLLADFPDAA